MNKSRILSLAVLLAMMLAMLLSSVSCSVIGDIPKNITGVFENETKVDYVQVGGTALMPDESDGETTTEEQSENLPVEDRQFTCSVTEIIVRNLVRVDVCVEYQEKYGIKAIVVITDDQYVEDIKEDDELKVTASYVVEGRIPIIIAEQCVFATNDGTHPPICCDDAAEVVDYYYSAAAKPELDDYVTDTIYRVIDVIQPPKSNEKMLLLTYLQYSGDYVEAAVSVPLSCNLSKGDAVYLNASARYVYCIKGSQFGLMVIPSEHTKQVRKPTQAELDEYYDSIAVPEKPVIYLYPEKDSLCSVKLELDGKLTCTYPEHGAQGWQNFIAKPDGTLLFPDGGEYYCLYWEGESDMEFDFSKGFCVKGSDTAEFLSKALADIGLTPREANEFIIYWLPKLQNNPYNVISFQTSAYTDKAKLEITPAPDSLLRVFMAAYASDTPINIQPQTFEGFEREGFCVVEWGGAIVNNYNN